MNKNLSATITSASNKWGLKLESLDSEVRRQLGFEGEEGVLITEVDSDSPASNVGLRGGDILVAVRGEIVNSPQQASSILENSPQDRPLPVLIYRNGASIYLALVP